MGLPLYLAMTAAEFTACSPLPDYPAWMACHFSPYGTGLTNLPPALPEKAMVILNDRIPIGSHDPEFILEQLSRLSPACLLLDFQRPGIKETAELVRILGQELRIPVGVAEPYGAITDGPVFLSPIPPDVPAEEYLAPWQGREIWLEAALGGLVWQVTESGAAAVDLGAVPDGGMADRDLCCHYRVTQGENRTAFSLWRTREDLNALLKKAAGFGVTRAVGLWQELGG
ncbi:MAG: hypothetical protein IKC09_00175 [Oscillospiraceae bacterium]|nr:hypothetical protein [Oscillospiraceae bacterium]